MKKLIFVLLCSVLSLSAFSQNDAMQFMGISMNNSMENFVNALEQKGFTKKSSTAIMVEMKGLFSTQEVMLKIVKTPKSSKAAYVWVYFFMNSDLSYESLRDILTKKYSKKTLLGNEAVNKLLNQNHSEILCWNSKNSTGEEIGQVLLMKNKAMTSAMYRGGSGVGPGQSNNVDNCLLYVDVKNLDAYYTEMEEDF